MLGRREDELLPVFQLGKIGEPDVDEQLHRVLEAGLARDFERLLVRLANLLWRDALLQPVVAGDEQFLDPLAGVVCGHVG